MSKPNDLKTMGLKATLPSFRILSLFESSAVRHLSAEDVYRTLISEGEDIGLATVYRVLTQFEQAGCSSATISKAERQCSNLPAALTTTIWYACSAAGWKNFTMLKSRGVKLKSPKIEALPYMSTRFRFTRIVLSPLVRIEKPKRRVGT